jgi:hypothetical protein
MPNIKPAGLFWGTLLRVLGFAGIYTPWGIYIVPRYYRNRALRRHELCHWLQRQRDGFIRYWLRTFWYLAKYGYENSPYEIEARKAALQDDAAHYNTPQYREAKYVR